MPKFYTHNSLDPFPVEKGSIQTVITSPPYFNLRNYRNDPRQIGQESTPEEYVAKMLQVGDNVREALSEDGTYWLNIGDTYDKNKSLFLIPHRVAIAMRDKGWILRNTVIWHKPNHMPCSIKDRLTPSHEYVFFFSKNRKYYFDLDSIREPHQTIKVSNHIDNEALSAKIGKDVAVIKQPTLMEIEFIEKTGYQNTKLEGESAINMGARGGFAKTGENLETRYSDGGKNPGDVYFQPEERKFTREDEQRAADEWGLIKGKSARITARLMMGMAKSHPLGKNPGDVHLPNTELGETNVEGSSGNCWILDGFELSCPSCGTEHTVSPDTFNISNPEDLWSINTYPFPDAHYAVFPPKLVQTIIRCSSKVGDKVLDPFSGSGTTAITADEMNRFGVGFDLSYDDVRERRVAKGIQQELNLP